MTKEYDEPITLELKTDREVMIMMFAMGVAAPHLLMEGKTQAAQVCSNLQIRLCSDRTEDVSDAVEKFSYGGIAAGDGEMHDISGPAGVAKMASVEEQDPDRINDGML